MTEPRLADHDAREAIRSRLDQSFLVEAGAGSGKTFSLVERMVALVTGGFCGVEEIAAVTFTRKAAGELRERFQLRLEQACREPGKEKSAGRAAAALERLDRVFIGTIHSFCSRLLRERPVEAAITPDFTEIEGMDERRLEERAWEEYLLEVRCRQPWLLDDLDRLDVKPGDLKDSYRSLLLYPDVEMAVADSPYPDLDPVRRELDKFLRFAESRMPAGPHPQKGWDGLQELVRLALRWERYLDLDDDRYLLRLLGRIDRRSAGPTLYCWPDRDKARAVHDAFHSFRENGAVPALQRWQEYRHKPLMGFLLPAAGYCRSLRQSENMLNFQDLLMHAAALLRDNPEVRGYFQQRYSRLLVDEFQDTDPIQAEVMAYLAGDDLHEKDWTRLKLRPGALFVVGDPKQSIYRFRRADIDTYNRVKELIVRSGGEVLYLTTNFRSVPQLTGWTNPAFQRLFAPAAPPYQAAFTAMDAFRRPAPGAAAGLRVLAVDSGSRQEETVEDDAARIASMIAGAVRGELTLSRPEPGSGDSAEREEEPCPGDFMILVGFKKDMAAYARALECRGIPFTLSGGGDMSGSLEMLELHCLLKSLADPGDQVALLAVLRGLFFGFSDDTLYRYRRAGGIFTFLEDPPEGADPGLGKLFREAWERFRLYRDWSLTALPSAALERIAGDLGLIPLSLAGSMAKSRARYIIQALELIRSREREGQTSFGDAVEFIERLLEEGSEEEIDLEGGRSTGVRIMNLHKAKGLEAPVVFLANPGRNPSHDPELHIRREASRSRGFFPVLKRGFYRSEMIARPPDWDVHAAEEERYGEAEQTRLLYVAATRARDLLVVSTNPRKPAASPWHPLEPFLENEQIIEKATAFPEPPAETPGEPVNPAVLDAARANITGGLRRIAAPGYTRLTAGELSGTAGPAEPDRPAGGRGPAWGNAVHGALEIMARHSKESKESLDFTETLAAEMLSRHGRPAQERDQLAGLLRAIEKTSFWQRVAAARKKFTEMPFGVWEDGSYLTGVIDLLFRDEKGWVLVDYKSDAVPDEDHRESLVQFYRPQLELYRRLWAALAGEPVVECAFFFTDKLAYISLADS